MMVVLRSLTAAQSSLSVRAAVVAVWTDDEIIMNLSARTVSHPAACHIEFLYLICRKPQNMLGGLECRTYFKTFFCPIRHFNMSTEHKKYFVRRRELGQTPYALLISRKIFND